MQPLRRRVENFIWHTRWRLARATGRRHNTLYPLRWADPPVVIPPPPAALVKSEQAEQIERVRREIELYARLSNGYFPREREISARDWQTLLECKNLKERIDHIKFMRLKELQAEKDKQKKEKTRSERRTPKEAAPSLAMPSSSSDAEGPPQGLVVWRLMDKRERYDNTARLLRSERLRDTPQVFIDCRFLPNLSHRAVQLTAQQILYLCVANRDRREPWPVSLVNYDAKREPFNRLREGHLAPVFGDGDANPTVWDVTARGIVESVEEKRADRVVYLSPHAEEELEEVESDKIYVIGGIVDRVTERGIPKDASRVAAEEAGVVTRKFPLDRYVKWQSGHRFLTLTAVLGILQDTFDAGGRDWEYALRKNIPVRNVRSASEKNSMARDHHERIREFDRRVREVIERELRREGIR